MEQLKAMASSSQASLQHQNNETFQKMKEELEQELNKLRNRYATLQSEHQSLRDEHQQVKHERDEALMLAKQASDATVQQVSAAAKASAALEGELERLREKNDQLQ